MKSKIAIIIGAGPAGLTAAYELLVKSDIKPIILEQSNEIGGISKTVVYKGNRIDIGGHRFFSKSDRVMSWWLDIMPLQHIESLDSDNVEISYQNKKATVMLGEKLLDPNETDNVMLIRNRLSRIYFLRHFFDYPISLSMRTLLNLGLFRIMKISFTYLYIRLFPIKVENSLEDFFINRFGLELYNTFFKDYTEKVWGVPCSDISAEWGAQRIKKLSITKAIKHALKSIVKKENTISQKNIETSLIERFMYPKYGPGQMWETVANLIVERGGIIIKNAKVETLNMSGNNLSEVVYFCSQSLTHHTLKGDYFFSTMPVKELARCIVPSLPERVLDVSDNLQYRDFITVGLLLSKLKISNKDGLIKDNWIYIQEKEVKLGRLQIFNNWSPYLVKDSQNVWLGLEYFCNEGDELWAKHDDEFIQFAIKELVQIDIISECDVLDHTIIRVPKTYPAYFGSYDKFDIIREFTDKVPNLFLVGRNGMHKYNNQDHSMLTAMMAVENILRGVTDKTNIWNINTEVEYHEEKKD